MPTKLFVYGTLRGGDSQRGHVLADQDFIGQAHTNPEMALLDLGAFPGLVFGGETPVVGEVYEIDEETESITDRIEGVNYEEPERGLYRREYIEVETEDGVRHEVLTYIFNNSRSSIQKRNTIDSGDWLEHTKKETKVRYG